MLEINEWKFSEHMPTELNFMAAEISDYMASIIGDTTLREEILNFFNSEKRIEVLYEIAREWDLIECVKDNFSLENR